MLTRHAVRSDAGFTLIELLVVIVILGVIVAPLSAVVIGVLKNQGATADRLMLSHDAQLSTAFFAQDVAATGRRDYSGQIANGTVPYLPSIELNAPYDNGGHTCGTAATPNALLRLLGDDWTNQQASTPDTDVVAYYLSGPELHRLKCAGATTTDVVVAHDVKPGSATVTCSTTCTGTPVPQQVTLTFTVSAPAADDYQIVLTGQRRQT